MVMSKTQKLRQAGTAGPSLPGVIYTSRFTQDAMSKPRSSQKRLTDQERAAELLTQARDILAARLYERVLELGSDLLDDARGESYGSEIDSLYDQIGTRLNQVNTMLAALPASTEVPVSESFSTNHLNLDHAPHFVQTVSPTSDVDGELTVSEDLITTQEPPARSSEPSTYPLFVQDIIRRDTSSAGQRLQRVLNVRADRAENCAMRFREQLDRDPAFLSKVQALRRALNAGDSNQSLLLLWECFGLQGEECTAAMQSLRGWL